MLHVLHIGLWVFLALLGISSAISIRRGRQVRGQFAFQSVRTTLLASAGFGLEAVAVALPHGWLFAPFLLGGFALIVLSLALDSRALLAAVRRPLA